MSGETPRTPAAISGRWLVVGMFAFAAAATAVLWVYWKLHVGPFVPLQEALAAEFPGSKPRVEGGQRKMSRGTPRILRITMQVDFDPQREKRKAEQLADRLAAFLRRHFAETAYAPVYTLQSYETLELHFYHPQPEERIIQQSYRRKVAEVLGDEG